MTQNGGFGQSFPPKTIAIVGVSRNDNMNHPGYTGVQLLHTLREAGFQGRIYPINPKASVIDGMKVYPNVGAVTEPLDLVIVTVPAAIVPQVLEDCAAAGALNVQICTSGFGETGDAEARVLEDRIRDIALKGGLRIIGPNCMGFQVPSVNMKMFKDVPVVQGPVAFISQSGGHARLYLLHGPQYGIGFSKVISYGNALLMDAPDFLEYLADDPETEIICMYLEGIKDGEKLARMVKQVNLAKPVVVWKGGLTPSGARAAASHTSSLAGNKQIWDAFFKQTGAIRVGSLADMVEVTSTIIHLKPTPSARAAVFVAGGGSSVAAGDVCAEEGLDVPALSIKTRKALRDSISLVNQGVGNPLDVPGVVTNAPALRRTFELLAADPSINVILLHLGADFFLGPMSKVFTDESILSFIRGNHWDVQVAVAVAAEGHVLNSEKYARELREAGIMAYSSLRSACRALHKFAGYHELLAENRK
ncbi:MAG: CoA-binding protein [Dehalococcoidia bacterium]|nr:CoA-binding protein [Dehalococcoidia bacterium]